MIIKVRKCFDTRVLRQLFFISGFLSLYNENYVKALKYFKRIRDIGDEESDKLTKMKAYEQMGLCYRNLKDYKNAIKCYKK